MTEKEASADIKTDVNLEVDLRVVIGKAETTHLIDKKEYPAALLVTAVDLEYVLEEHLKRYYRKHKSLIEKIGNEKLRNDLGKARKKHSGSLGLYISFFGDVYGKYYNNPDYPDWSEEIPKEDWDKKKGDLSKLNQIRNEIAHDRGTYRKIRKLKHETYNSVEDVNSVIDSVYEFCQQYPA